MKERARAAVAGEAGQAVGDAVRDLLTAALAGLLPAAFADPHRPGPGGRWGDEGGPARDPWADRDDEDDWRRGTVEVHPPTGNYDRASDRSSDDYDSGDSTPSDGGIGAESGNDDGTVEVNPPPERGTVEVNPPDRATVEVRPP